MYYDNILMTYTFAVVLFPFLACLLIIFTMGRGKHAIAAIAVLSAMMSLFLSCIAAYIVFKNPNYSLLIDFPWITTQASSIHAVFIMNKLSSLFLVSVSLVFMLIHLYVFSIFNSAENEVLVKIFSLNSLAHSFLLITFISASLIQIYVFVSLSTVLMFLIRLIEKHNESSVNSAKIEFIANISSDMFLFVGTLLLSNSFGTSMINQLYVYLSEAKFVNNPQALTAIVLIFLFVICKLGFYPFSMIFLNNSEDYPACFAGKIALYHTGIAFFVLILIKPFSSVMPSVCITILMFWALLTALILVYQSIICKNILHIAGSICFANNCLLSIVVLSDIGLSYLFLLSISILIITLLLIIIGYLMAITHTNLVWETGNASKYMKLLLVACTVSVLFLAGLPPLSGFWRNAAIFASGSNKFLLVIASIVLFFMAFSAMRLYTVIFFGQKNSEFQAKTPSALISVILAVLTLVVIVLGNLFFPFLSSSMGDYINMYTHASISISNFRMAFILSILGVVSGFLCYFKLSEEKEDMVLSYLTFKNIFNKFKRSKK